jgi:hypothetical protein
LVEAERRMMVLKWVIIFCRILKLATEVVVIEVIAEIVVKVQCNEGKKYGKN